MRTPESRPWLLASVAALCAAATADTLAQAWGPPQFVTSDTAALTLAANGSGNAVMLLTPPNQFVGLQAIVETNGAWSSPVNLSSTAIRGSVAVAPNGDALAVWSSTSDGIRGAFYRAGTWSKTFTLSTVSSAVGLGYDAQNNATVAWQDSSSGPCKVLAASGTAASGLGSPRTLNTTCYTVLDLAVNSAGQALVVQGAGTLEVAPIVGVFRDTNGVWGAPFDVAGPAYGRQRPQAGLAGNGNAVVVWRARTFGEYAVRENGAWSGSQTLPQSTGSVYPAVAVDGAGNAVAAYLGRVAYRPVGGPFGTPITLSVADLVATPGGTFAGATGSEIVTLLPGSTTWNQSLATSGGVIAAPGRLIAFVNPPISLSTAIVP